MPAFICSRCGSIDNSACKNTYWASKSKRGLYERGIFNKYPVCTACTPKHYDIKDEGGKGYQPTNEWHNIFERRNINDDCYNIEEILRNAKLGKRVFENTLEYFEKFANMSVEEFDKLVENNVTEV